MTTASSDKIDKDLLKKFSSVPETKYFNNDIAFGEQLGKDFIAAANDLTTKNKYFLVGLAHGQSPSFAYQYILSHYHEIQNPELIWFTFTNSRLKRQRDLENVMDSYNFVRALLKKQFTTKDKIFGADFSRDNLQDFVKKYNKEVNAFLIKNNKNAYDFAFIASDPQGKVAGIAKNSSAFKSDQIMVIVEDELGEQEITVTPNFLLKSARLAYIATKSDKRRSLAWLYSKWSNPEQSPSFLRFMPQVDKRLTVYIDDKALTWPQIELKRKTDIGISSIKLDFAIPFDEQAIVKKPVIIMIHGFLGLNSFDSLLTEFPTHKYVATAMHYGTVPQKLKPEDYSKNILKNIDFVVNYFGELGHDVYILDHSIANIYFLMQDREYHNLKGIPKYLKGRIGINPFFAEEAKHATVGFLDYVIMPALKFKDSPSWKSAIVATRAFIPFDTKKGARKKGKKITKWLIDSDESKENSKIWVSLKERILYILTAMDSLPMVDIVPLKKALSRLNAKLFAIQIYSALNEYESFDEQKGLQHFNEHNLPILIIKSERDAVAKFVPRLYADKNVSVLDVTRYKEKNLFKEHLYHMLYPNKTVEIVADFIEKSSKN
jgi:6-phosphogluconolactonase/glucosamine-6-phosphate isomerase/deaminase